MSAKRDHFKGHHGEQMGMVTHSALQEAQRPTERLNAMSFADQVVEAFSELTDAKIEYARARRSIGGEYANSDEVEKAQVRLTELLSKVRFAL